MNSPYNGNFKVSQQFKGPAIHDGLDLVGLSNKDIHAVVAGRVIRADWENAADHKQGFGLYVKVEANNGDIWYYGHLSQNTVKVGDTVSVGTKIGVEGSTGKSTGSHLHICCRPKGIKASAKDVSKILGIPNAIGIYNDGHDAAVKKEEPKPTETSTSAKSFNKDLSGTYKTTARLNFRKSPNGEIIKVLPLGTTVRCYGYYTDNWYLVTCDGVTGFVSKEYIKKG